MFRTVSQLIYTEGKASLHTHLASIVCKESKRKLHFEVYPAARYIPPPPLRFSLHPPLDSRQEEGVAPDSRQMAATPASGAQVCHSQNYISGENYLMSEATRVETEPRHGGGLAPSIASPRLTSDITPSTSTHLTPTGGENGRITTYTTRIIHKARVWPSWRPGEGTRRL